MAQCSGAPFEFEGISLVVQAGEEDREGELRVGVPGAEDRGRVEVRGQGFFQGGDLQ